jgi:hypothetical protein
MQGGVGGWVPLAAVARAMGWSYNVAYAKAIKGEFGAQQLEGRWWFRRAAVERALKEREAVPAR